MKNIDISVLKKHWKYFLVVGLLFLSIGILLDHYVFYPFFTPRKDNCIQTNVAVDNTEVLLDKKVSYNVTPKVESSCNTYVDVSGAVKEPGVYCLTSDSLIIDAINKAGGFSEEVAYRFVSRKYNLAKVLSNNQKIYIPYSEELSCTLIKELTQEDIVEIVTNDIDDITDSTTSPFWIDSSDPKPSETTPTSTSSANSCVNLNTASLEQLQTLSGVGASTAQKIVDGRPYSSVEDLLNVSGIGESTFNKIESNLCI